MRETRADYVAHVTSHATECWIPHPLWLSILESRETDARYDRVCGMFDELVFRHGAKTYWLRPLDTRGRKIEGRGGKR